MPSRHSSRSSRRSERLISRFSPDTESNRESSRPPTGNRPSYDPLQSRWSDTTASTRQSSTRQSGSANAFQPTRNRTSSNDSPSLYSQPSRGNRFSSDSQRRSAGAPSLQISDTSRDIPIGLDTGFGTGLDTYGSRGGYGSSLQQTSSRNEGYGYPPTQQSSQNRGYGFPTRQPEQPRRRSPDIIQRRGIGIDESEKESSSPFQELVEKVKGKMNKFKKPKK